MLKMMAYKRANKILNSFLTPNEYCIARGTAETNNADTTAMSNWITAQGYQSSDFPSNRLMPTDAIKYQGQTEFCYIPFDDLVMHISDNGQAGKRIDTPQGSQPSQYRLKEDHGGVQQYYYAWTSDSAMAGYTYTVNSVIYENSNATYGDHSDEDWLLVEINNPDFSEFYPEAIIDPTTGNIISRAADINYSVVDGHPVINKIVNAKPVSDPSYVGKGSIIYYAKHQPFDVQSPLRRAKVIIDVTRNNTWCDQLEEQGYTPATNVCDRFSVTIQQAAADDGDNGIGFVYGEVPMKSNTSKITLTLSQASTANNANADFVAMCRSYYGYSGYWIKGDNYIGVSQDQSPIYSKVHVIEQSGGVEKIEFDIDDILSLSSSYNNEFRFFVFGNWSGAQQRTGLPPKCNSGGLISATLSNGGSDAGDTISSYIDPSTHQSTSIQRKVFSSGNLNLPLQQPYASIEEVQTRCTCLFEVKYVPTVVDGSVVSSKIVLKAPDKYDTWNHSGINPVLYPMNFTWLPDYGLLSREYAAVQGTRTNTHISVVSDDGTDSVAFKLYVNDPLDSNQYTVTVNGASSTLTANNPLVIEDNDFYIDFSNVESGSVTKQFKLQQYIPSERPQVHDGNASPEYAEIYFTFQ